MCYGSTLYTLKESLRLKLSVLGSIETVVANENFIDKVFSVLADLLLKVLPASKEAKKSFLYYRQGLKAHSSGSYVEALKYYKLSLQFEEDPVDRGYIYYNCGVIYYMNEEVDKSISCYKLALSLNPCLVQAMNNLGVAYHARGCKLVGKNQYELAALDFEQAKLFWRKATALEPDRYLETQNWIRSDDRISTVPNTNFICDPMNFDNPNK
jgi:tetratricopeptide (TPR) repeat protein